MSFIKVKLKLFFEVLFFLAISFIHARGATYYVASDGDDHHSLIQATNPSTPWQTIDKINSVNFKEGDVILFRRGDVFRGQINIKINKLSFGAYGNGIEPVISGAVVINNWNRYKGDIYFAHVDQFVKNLFVNGQQMILARYPNKGFLYTQKANGKSGFTDSHLSQKPGYWVGANVRVNVFAWNNETRVVSEFTHSSLVVNSPFDFNISSDRAYYIDNKLSELDTDNEWFYDTTSHFVYLYASKGSNPNKWVVEGAVYKFGFRGTNNSGIDIEGLQIEKQGIDGIFLTGNNNSIFNNKIYDERERGINMNGDAIKIEKNIIKWANAQGIDINGSINSIISMNIVKDIGLIVAYGGLGFNDAIGIVSTSTAATNDLINYNEIDSTGYCGILFDASNTVIEKNIIRYSLLSLADGGGIYMWGKDANGNTIRYNFIFNTMGFDNGKPGGIARGIYLDDDVRHTEVIHNTVINSNDNGIFFHNGDYNSAKQNVVYGSAHTQFYIADQLFDSASSCHNRISDNIFYATNEKSIGMLIDPNYNNYSGKIDSNTYFSPSPGNMAIARGRYFSLEKWQSFSKLEKHSKQILPNLSGANSSSKIFTNTTDNEVVIDLKKVSYKDLDGNVVAGRIKIPAWSSKILITR